MEEVDFKELFEIFWNKKLQIILIIIILGILGAIYSKYFVIPEYESSTTLVLAKSDESEEKTTTTENSITTTDVTLNSKLVSTYSELVKSKNVLRQVISNLNIDIEEDDLRKNVKVTSVEDTELIEITVTNQNPEYTEKIANEIAKVFTEKVSEIYNINNVYVVDEAEVSSEPSNINHIKDIVIFMFVGVIIAVIYVLIVNMFDTTIKTTEDIEKGFKLPVLASIPTYNLEDKKGGNA